MTESNKKPEIVVFAGPNGSGKSTITKLLKPAAMDYINADDIKRILNCDDMTAAVTAEKQREQHISDKKDFCFETVLSTDRNIKLLRRAKNAGYFIRCYYILTVDPHINAARIFSRVLAGGHDVPTDKIISRYDKALALLPELISLCDICHIYDNSLNSPYRIFKKRKDKYWYCVLPNNWNKNDIRLLTGVDSIKFAALNQNLLT